MIDEDRLRRIVREEIEAAMRPMVPRYNPPGSGLVLMNANSAMTYTPPATNVPEGRRMGCTCPPGRQTSCPDVTCPWKPR